MSLLIHDVYQGLKGLENTPSFKVLGFDEIFK
jgi:hypothetical protein